MINNTDSKDNLADDVVPLIAILRGVTPDTIIGVAEVLVAAGFGKIEVPLNSPKALESIRSLVSHFGTKTLSLGAGTVTRRELAEEVLATGANLVVTPNCNTEVIKMAVDANCETYPGVVTPTEAFNAIHAGATSLKLFPVSMVGCEGIKAIRSVIPPHIKLFPVGGIDAKAASMAPYIKVGAAGFGLGSALYKPDMTLAQIRVNAEAFVREYRQCVDPQQE